jgi:hypothetical protein
MENNNGQPHTSKARRTRCNVAGLLKIRSVEPRAIAYIAVQVRSPVMTTLLAITNQALASFCVIQQHFLVPQGQ